MDTNDKAGIHNSLIAIANLGGVVLNPYGTATEICVASGLGGKERAKAQKAGGFKPKLKAKACGTMLDWVKTRAKCLGTQEICVYAHVYIYIYI